MKRPLRRPGLNQHQGRRTPALPPRRLPGRPARVRGRSPACAGGELAMEREHQSPRGGVRHRHDARDDRARAHPEQRRGEAEQLVARVQLRERQVAGREHEHVGRAAEGLQVERRERSVGELERREQRAVRAQPAVAGDVGERRAVECAAASAAVARGSTVAPDRSRRARAPRPRRGGAAGPPRARPCGAARCGRASSAAHTASDGATTTGRPRSEGSAPQGSACRAPAGRRRPAPRRAGAARRAGGRARRRPLPCPRGDCGAARRGRARNAATPAPGRRRRPGRDRAARVDRARA